MNLSDQEKSIWGSLVIVILVSGYYFATLVQMLLGAYVDAGNVAGRMIGVIVTVIVVEIVHGSLMGAATRPEGCRRTLPRAL